MIRFFSPRAVTVSVTGTARRNPRKSRPLSFSTPIEALEARQLLTLTDVSQLAAQTPAHNGPTNLYINFDGGTVPLDPVNNPSGATETVRPFEEEPGDGNLNRDRDIQEVLFEVAEDFAPFNVEVHRIDGAGNYSKSNGDTTVFVGGDPKNETITPSYSPKTGVTYHLNKFVAASTPGGSLDFPVNGHVINSHPYDIAFVDPVTGSSTSPGFPNFSVQMTEHPTDSAGHIIDYTHVNMFDIVRRIAHEAGHTFGLSHVRTDGGADPSPLGPGNVNDIMSYDSPNVFFADRSLNLTSFNYNPASNTTTPTGSGPNIQNGFGPTPAGHGTFKIGPLFVPLLTQNSYATLDDVLGARPTDQYANVANAASVDPIYGTLGRINVGPGAAPKIDLSHKTSQFGTQTRLGDDQVFTFTPQTSGLYEQQSINVQATSGGFKPELLIYDSTGQTLEYYADPSSTGFASVKLPNGSSYQVVVASQDGNSTGTYRLTVNTVFQLPVVFFPSQFSTSLPSNKLALSTPAGTVSNSVPSYVPLLISTPDLLLNPVLATAKSTLKLAID